MTETSANPSPTPRDAAAVILLRHQTDPNNPEVFWVKRNSELAFLGGYHAFPGGSLEAGDWKVPVENCNDPEEAVMISCVARELFEEAGVLLARGSQTLTVGQRASLLDDLESGRMSWPQLLQHYDLSLDAKDFTFIGRWVTPPFAPRRFDTWFFLVNCPAKQEPLIIPDSEHESGEWISAREAFQKWKRNEVITVPPTLHALQTLAAGMSDDLVERFLSNPGAHRQPRRRIEFHAHYICFPVRTPTKPPATHTNCYLIYTSREILIIDPGSPYEDEQQAVASCVDDLIKEGRAVREIVLTHRHPDHVAGVNVLNDYFEKNFSAKVPVAAHRLTAEDLGDQVSIDRFIEDEEIIQLNGAPRIALRAMHTPGHARGHLCFHDERTGALITGDNVVGFGSVLIDPPEGNMRDYLASLKRMRDVAGLTILLPGHGPAVANPYRKLDEYLTHRLQREASILASVREGAETPKQIVARVYTDVSPKAHAMAERAVLAHLEKLEADGMVSRNGEGSYS